MNKLLTLTCMLFFASFAQAAFTKFALTSSGGGGGGGTTPFSLPTGDVIHYIAPLSSPPTGWAVGNDTNNGTSQLTPWATPAHALNCGDVVIVAPGTYGASGSYPNGSAFYFNFGTVSTCPSTSGGIDGAGGIWFAIMLCGGTDISSTNGCFVTGSGGQYNIGFYGLPTVQNNIAFEGFYLNGGGTDRGFGARDCLINDDGVTYFKSHHLALINSVSVNSLQSFGGNDCGAQSGVANDFWDYIAAVGIISQNGAQDSICLGAIDFTQLGNFDTNPGTHAYAYGDYAIHNRSPSCVNNFDGEAFLTDSPDVHLFSQLVVYSNDIAYDSTRMCINYTAHGATNPTVSFVTYNVTCFANNQTPGSTSVNSSLGELNISGDTNWTMLTYNNIADPNVAANSGVPLYAQIVGGAQLLSWKEGTVIASGLQNVFVGFQTTCISNCAPTTSPFAEAYFNSNPVATNTQNTFSNPTFTNTADLLANQVGAPTCVGFVTTTACMGWNANTSTLTTPSVISDLVPTAGGTAGKGFQLPSTTCVEETNFTGSISGTTLTVSGVSGNPIMKNQMVVGAGVTTGTVITGGSGTSWTVNNSQSVGSESMGASFFPYWLKGIVYLHWTGSQIFQQHDLATTPCGL